MYYVYCTVYIRLRCKIHRMQAGWANFRASRLRAGFWVCLTWNARLNTTFWAPEMHIMPKTINHEKHCLKIVYSKLIEVADSESDLSLCNRKVSFREYLQFITCRIIHFVDQDVVVIDSLYTLYLSMGEVTIWLGGLKPPPRIFKITIEFSDYPPSV